MLPHVPATACVFCRIAAGRLPAGVLIDRPGVLAILDTNPIHPGHALVFPRAHHQDFLSLPRDLLPEVITATQDVAQALVQTLKLQGVNIFSNNGEIAGQSVFHAHIHVTPRYPHDGIRFVPVHGRYGPGELDRMAGLLREHLNGIR